MFRRLFFLLATLLALASVSMPRAEGSWGSCSVAVAAPAQAFSGWEARGDEPHILGYFVNGVQVAGYNSRTHIFRDYDVTRDKWGEAQRAPWAKAEPCKSNCQCEACDDGCECPKGAACGDGRCGCIVAGKPHGQLNGKHTEKQPDGWVCCSPPPGDAEEVEEANQAARYATGRVLPSDIEERKVRSAQRNAGFQFPRAAAKQFDWCALGCVPPIVAQGNCGSCWDFAGCGTCTMAAIKAGHGKADGSYRLSEQYVLDCGRNGGCHGDDHSSVFEMALKGGLPLAAEYGPYNARPGHCKTATHFQKIKAWGYCEPGARGPASTQSIKDAMVAKGPISVAIAATSSFMNIGPGTVFSGNSRGINHEVILVGWDDDKGAWKLRNSWGTGWADSGYCWIKYGANGVGTDAAWVEVAPVDPPPPPPPGPLLPPVNIPPAAVMGGLALAATGYLLLKR